MEVSRGHFPELSASCYQFYSVKTGSYRKTNVNETEDKGDQGHIFSKHDSTTAKQNETQILYTSQKSSN